MENDRQDKGRILLVEDQLDAADLIRSVLEGAGYSVYLLTRVAMALEQLELIKPDLILLGIRLPETDWYDTCRMLKARDGGGAAIIVLSDRADTLDTDRILDTGAVGYLIRPVVPEELLAWVKDHMTIVDLERELRETNERLEELVTVRVSELSGANEALRREIAERKRSEEYRTKLLAQLMKAGEQAREQQLYAQLYLDQIGQDISGMSQVSLGYLEMALKTLDEEGRLDWHNRSLIEKPVETLKNSSRLIGNLGKLHGVLAGTARLKPVGVCTAINEAVSDCEIGKGRDVVISFTPVPEIRVNSSELLKDVFFNIISNAIKHAPPASALTIDVRAQVVRENGASYAWVTIEDDGPGIPEDKKRAVFKRVRRGMPGTAGEGLGLYLVRLLVEDFDGMVWVENRISGDYRNGSKFVVVLPVLL